MQKSPILGATCAFLLATPAAYAVQTDNHGIHAVPAPAKVAIDGEMKEWDTSGQILVTYDIENLKDIYSAQVSAMYDADNFYLAIHWKDQTPMGNSHDPRYQANHAWAGDAIQLRFKTDRISHITAWYYGPKNEPGLQFEYGKGLTDPFNGGSLQLFPVDGGWKLQQGAEMAFRKDADGKGYVQELKLPWKLITSDKIPGPGEKFSLGMELLWGQTDWPEHRYADNLREGATSREFFWTAHDNWGPVTLEPKGNLKLPEPAYLVEYKLEQESAVSQGPVEIGYDLPKDARVSLVIEDAKGARIRNLVPALARKKGRNIEKWDGLNDVGKPVDPGDYRFKAIYHDGIHANYALSFASPGNPSWDTPDGRGAFYADHSPPKAAAAAGNFVALAAPVGEAGKSIIGLDMTGQRLWGLAGRSVFDVGNISLATDGKTLWVANEGQISSVYRVNIATGKYKPWNAKGKDKDGNEFQVLDLKVSEEPGIRAGKGLRTNLVAIAERNGNVAICLAREGLIKVLDGNTGEVKQEYKIETPRSVLFTNDGGLLALSKGQIFRLGTDGQHKLFSLDTFQEPQSLAADIAGNVYISTRGTDHNVKVLSPTGQLIREIGAKGGRPHNGAFNPNAMRLPAQIAVDSQNRLWVTEETLNPKRTSLWDTQTGQLIKDFNGTTHYCASGSLNPFNQNEGYSDDTVYQLDWKTGTSKPIWSLGKRDDPNDVFPPSVHNLKSRIVKRGDKTYIYTTGSALTAREIQCTAWDGKTWRSVSNIGVVPSEAKTGQLERFKHPAFTGKDGQFYAWTDQNGDGLVQTEEVKFTTLMVDGKPMKTRHYIWGQLPDTEGTAIFMGSNKDTLLKFPITGANAVGAPIYDIEKPQIVKLDRPLLGGGNGQGMLIGGSKGRVYLNQDPIITVEKDGRVVGGYRNKHISVHGSHTASAAKPGYLIGPSEFLGTADIPNVGEVFYLNGNLGENTLFTEDSIYIQTLFKDIRGYFTTPDKAVRGMNMDLTTAGGESFGGNFIRAQDGKNYVTLGGTDARVMEVTGLESIKRLEGKINFTPALYAKAQTQKQEQAAKLNAPKEYLVAKSQTTPAIDGKSADWPELLDEEAKLLEIQDNPRKRFARVAARYDSENLYLGYRILSSTYGLKNAGQDQRLMFKSGDAVDLMIGPEKSAKGEGNLRLLLTKQGNQPLVVLNQKVAPGAAETEKFDFSSPWRTISFDRVVVVPNVTFAGGAIKGGYFVETAIPWKTLGLTPKSGLKLRGDVGVLFADTGGTQTVSRQYWSNKVTGLVNDVPGEADLTPNLWGTLTLE